MTDAETQLYDDLTALGIGYAIYEHPAVFTVAESNLHTDNIPGAHTKNLFLKDKAGHYFLVTVPADARVDLKALPSALGCGRVSFGKAEDMERLLGVTPGSVTPLAAFNDTEKMVNVVLDTRLAGAECVNVHPLRNTATLGLSGTDLVMFLAEHGHTAQVVDLPAPQ